jgi:hypothetical protein
MKKLIAGFILGAVTFGGGAAAYAAKNTDNDRVLSGARQEYLEYFKTDKSSCNRSDCKNYLYTVTNIDAPKPGKCVVISGDSEKTLAISCNNGQQ